MLFHIITVDTIHSFVQKVSVTELDIIYLTAVCELNLFNKIIQGDSLARDPKQIWGKYSRIWRNAFKCAWM